jgi:hypothetical protein
MFLRKILSRSALLLLVACGQSSGPDGGSDSATLSGTVTDANGSGALKDAQITVGQRQATSDASGHFEVTGLPVGGATVQAQRPGYLLATTTVTLGAGANTYDFALAPQEVFVSGPDAMFVPAGAGPIRGVVILLGGPYTNGFVTGGRIEPLNDPVLEQQLQSLGQSLRSLATSSRVALYGSSTTGMANGAASDNAIFTSIAGFATVSGHAELSSVPFLLAGFSGGAPEAAGMVARNPSRAIGLVVRVPSSVTDLTAATALAVPTLVMQAEFDSTVSNFPVATTFAANRSRGGLWALVVEPGVNHHVASGKANTAQVQWIGLALSLRLGAQVGDPLNALSEQSGWLGDPTTLDIAPWASYTGDPTTASWLFSNAAATAWQDLGTAPSGG